MRSLVLMAVLATGSCWDTPTPDASPTAPLLETHPVTPEPTPSPTGTPAPTVGECPTPRALQADELVPYGTVFRSVPVVE